jgi:hypothetical protein
LPPPPPLPRVVDELSDLDPFNPVDCSADTWSEIFAEMDDFEDFLDHDHGMDH